jgi:hypothetical protein
MANGRHSFVAFYPSDWLAGTARLTRLHRSVFFDVCCYTWDTAKPCPPVELAVMVGDLKNGATIINDLVSMGKLVRLDDGSVVNSKAMIEAEKAFAAWQKMSDGGSKPKAKPDTKPPRKGVGKPQPNGHGIEPEPEPEGKDKPYPTPEGVEDGTWQAYVDARKKHPLTDESYRLIVKTLGESPAPQAAVAQSVMNGWRGIFPLKGRTNGADARGSGWNGDKRSGLGRAIDRELGQ